MVTFSKDGAKRWTTVDVNAQNAKGDTSSKTKSYAKSPRKSARKNEPVFGKLMKPFEWVAKSVAWLANPGKDGGGKYIMYGMSGYCFLLSAETVYVSLPVSGYMNEAGITAPRFLPKPAIADEANFALLNPLPVMWNMLKRGANVTLGQLAFYPRHTIEPRVTIWADGNWYVAALIAALIGAIEAMAIRRTKDSWERKLNKLKELNKKEVPDYNPNAVFAARIAKQDLQTEGTGNYLMVAILIIGVYGTEFFCFVRSLRGLQLPFFVTLLYALINVFGFEICWALAQEAEDAK